MNTMTLYFKIISYYLHQHLNSITSKVKNLITILSMCRNWYDVLSLWLHITKSSDIHLYKGITITLTREQWYNFLCLIRMLREDAIYFKSLDELILQGLDFKFRYSEAYKAWQLYSFYKKYKKATTKLSQFHIHKADNDLWIVEFYFQGRKVKFYTPYEALGTFLLVYYNEVYDDPHIKGSTIIDVGAFIGDTPIYFALKGAKRVVALEPMPLTYKICIENVKLNGLEDKIEVRNIAVGAKTGYIALFQVDKLSLTSFQTGHEIRVPSVRLSALINKIEESEKNNIILKMDCEGCEYESIPEAINSGTLLKVSLVMVELHGKLRQIMRIIQLLKQYGFKVKVLFYGKAPSPINHIVLIKGVKK